MAITAAFDLEAHQYDAVSASTNSSLDDTVYCEYPESFQQPGKCLFLLQALYRLRQSPLLWLKEFSSTLNRLGLQITSEAECLFTNDRLVVLFFVDDIVVLYQTKHYNDFTTFATKLAERYELRNLGNLKWFLGIRMAKDRTEGTVSLSQDSYIEKMATTFNIHEQSRYPKTPMLTEELLPYDGTATPMQIYEYQRKVGSLLYATSMTRPDVARTASKLAEYLLNPGPKHHEAFCEPLHTYSIRNFLQSSTQQLAIQNGCLRVHRMQPTQMTPLRGGAQRDISSVYLVALLTGSRQSNELL